MMRQELCTRILRHHRKRAALASLPEPCTEVAQTQKLWNRSSSTIYSARQLGHRMIHPQTKRVGYLRA